MQIRWKMMGLMVAASAMFMLGGCGGKDGKDGRDGKDAASAVTVAALAPEQWSDLSLKAEVLSVAINSPPVVKFKVSDGAGNPVVGLAQSSKSTTNKLATYPNVSFSLAKLVPATNGSPSKWVNYIVTAVSNTTGEVTGGQRPSTENIGSLVDHGDGTYTYTFYRDITKVKEQVAAFTDSGNNRKADLGDLTYDPTLTHRLAIQISGAARGTGSNTADGSNSGVTAVNLKDPLNLIYDFIPATGKAITSANTQRDIVSTASCNECHSKLNALGFHGGSRNEARFCVVCHTDQRKFGRAASTSTGNAFTGTTYVADGEVQGDFPVFIHKLHLGEHLGKTGYDYAGVAYNHITYPQPITNCVKCHSKAPQAANWSSVPSRLACGSCHDGVNWSTGAGHIGGSATNDANCALCHKSADITRYHVTIDRSTSGTTDYASQLALPAGAKKIEYQIKDVKVVTPAGDTKRRAQITFRILMDGAPVTFKAYTAGATQLLDNFTGGPTLYAAIAVPREGIASPADFNTSISASLVNIWNGTQGTLGARDADGYYTATIGLPADLTARYIPNDAVMVSGVVGMGAFAQTNVAGFTAKTFNIPATAVWKEATGTNGNGVTLKARRKIVDAAKCNNCHGQLGIGPTFHSGVRNGGDMCALCHTPDYSTGHVSATQLGGGWSVSAKDLMHGIHAGAKRVVPFTYDSGYDFSHVTYPGVLKNCEQCHLPGTYDFRNAANADAVNSNSLLWNNAAHGIIRSDAIWKSQWVAAGNYGSRPSYSYTTNTWTYTTGVPGTADPTPANGGNLVHSPVASACFGCHDSAAAVSHMRLNGGSIYENPANVTVGGRGTAFTKVESCMACHGAGKAFDIKAVHGK
ncbi:OmcA/MtrC family decaheme c-type cytochrome [Trichlorobacter ammonificans]|uniref:MULTIHEME_CYTC domain-containing protein n=1 Tax=Trichlorobacter ammonificans TaxID=2916410 RepID=A0ABN8HH58_9BACT|nr:OmcA/MtrC family decaheme c-type cytochrome [Trichlorobacter ammonificans]CAH2030195.1 MULTIHEME_CYTC domain-containing protein [Trichlorobacter ammonificans]